MKNLTEDAYKREMALIPVVIDMEQQGVRIHPEIHSIQAGWQYKFDRGEAYLKKAVPAEPGTKAWFTAARKKGLIDESKLQYTDKGNPRYGRKFLADLIYDDELRNVLEIRSKLQKALSTYINPYAAAAKMYDGRFHPYFSQTRGENDYGTRTGRFSSNFQQLPRNPPEGEELPNLRALVYPEVGHTVIKRDFNGQELRVSAHYAEGNILAAYQANPMLDVHTWVKEFVKQTTGIVLDRVVTKTISFLKLYGGGPGKLALMLGISDHEARMFFSAYDAALPEFKELMKMVERMARSGQKIRTWGGRLYDVEPAQIINGRKREFYYKLGNILIQGSSADMTKEAMNRYYYHPDRKGRMMMVVHDEIVVSAPSDRVKEEMELLRYCMDDIPGWDVPLRSEGKIGKSFGEMEKYDD
jgi:DNA polymerase I